MNVSRQSGSLRLRVASARLFGLLGNDRGSAVLTNLGQRIVDPETSAEARVEAFLNVESYNRIYSDFQGQLMPSASALETALRNVGVAEKFATVARRVFIRSANYAGFVNRGRLIRPTVHPSESAEGDDASDSVHGVSGATAVSVEGVVTVTHPVLRGLLEMLPEDGEFENGVKGKWFDLFRGAFEMVYGPLDPNTE